MRASLIALTAIATTVHASCTSEDIIKRCSDFSSNAIASCSPDDFVCQHIQMKAIDEYCRSICEVKSSKAYKPIHLEDTWRMRLSDLAAEDTHLASDLILPKHKRDINGFDDLKVTTGDLIQALTLKQISQFNGGPPGFSDSVEGVLRPGMADFYGSDNKLKKRRTYTGIGSTFQLHLKDPKTGEVIGTHELFQDGDDKAGYKEFPIARYQGAFLHDGEKLPGTRLYWDDNDESDGEGHNLLNTTDQLTTGKLSTKQLDGQLNNQSDDQLDVQLEDQLEQLKQLEQLEQLEDSEIATSRSLDQSNTKDGSHATLDSSTASVTLYLDRTTSPTSLLVKTTSSSNSSGIAGLPFGVVNRIKKKLNINAVYNNNTVLRTSRHRDNLTTTQTTSKRTHNGAYRPVSSVAAIIVAIAFMLQ